MGVMQKRQWGFAAFFCVKGYPAACLKKMASLALLNCLGYKMDVRKRPFLG